MGLFTTKNQRRRTTTVSSNSSSSTRPSWRIIIIIVVVVVMTILIGYMLLLLHQIVSYHHYYDNIIESSQLQYQYNSNVHYYTGTTQNTFQSTKRRRRNQHHQQQPPRDSSSGTGNSRRSNNNHHHHTNHTLVGLTCHLYGGPTTQTALNEMIYWYNISSDTNYNISSSSSSLSSKSEHQNLRYLTFEPDMGGWNNIRMALETTILLAISMQRILVLPPNMKYYLLWNEKKRKQSNKKNQQQQQQQQRSTKGKNVMGFDDFFHLQSIQDEYSNLLQIITMEEFLTHIANTGQLKSRTTHQIRYPPKMNDLTSIVLQNSYGHSKKRGTGDATTTIVPTLWEYIRDVTQPLLWNSDECVAVFPDHQQQSSSTSTVSERDGHSTKTFDPDTQRQYDYLQRVLQNDEVLYRNHHQQLDYKERRSMKLYHLRQNSYNNHPTNVNGTTVERLSEILAHRKQLCIYNQSIHQQYIVLHITGSEPPPQQLLQQNHHYQKRKVDESSTTSTTTTTTNRFLIHFYAFLFYENYHTDLFMKRFIRDHLRYIDEIQCGAARIIEAIRNIARTNHDRFRMSQQYDNTSTTATTTSDTGQYDSFHIRRGDFQYDFMHMSAQEIYDSTTSTVVPDGRTVYIATDEMDISFFHTFQNHYNVVYLQNFTYLIPDINPNYYGMIDQLIASKAEVFVGTFLSTFSGYINRLRGYHAQKLQSPGYELGHIQSYYYVPEQYAPYRTVMQTYRSVQGTFWPQEFPVAWRDINHDVKEKI